MTRLRIGIIPKLTLVFVLFAAGLLSVVSFLVFENARTSLQAATVSELLSTSIEKQSALNAWVADRAGDVLSMSTSAHVQEEVASLIATTDPTARQTAHDHMVQDLGNWIGGAHNIRELLIIAPADGRVIVATDASEEGKFKEDQPYFVNGKKAVYVQNPYYDLVLQGPTLTIAAPIWSSDGRLLAVLAGQLDMTEVNAIVNRRTGLHRTDDAFLANTSNLFVTQPRLAKDQSVLQRGVHSEAVERCLARNSGTITTDDYRGIPALIAYRWLPDRQLCLVVKIDQAEAFAAEQSLRDTILTTSVIVLLLASALAFGLARTITRPVSELTRGAEEIGKDNLEYRIKPQGSDEIGQLASAFNLMTANLGRARGELRAWGTELEQRVAERTAELSASEERYRILAETSPDMIFVIDRADQVQYVNTLAARQFGKTPEQVTGKPRTELFPPSIATGQGILLQQVLKTGEPQSSESAVAFVGVQLWLDTQLVPLRNAAGEVSAVMGVSRNITARKRAEEELKKNEEKFRQIFNNANDAIYIWSFGDRKTLGKCTEVNAVACKMLGYSKEELLQMSPADINAENIREKMPAMLAPLLSQGHMVTESLHRTKDGRTIPVEVSSRIVELMGETKLLSVARDITERKQAESAVREQAALLNLAHDAILVRDMRSAVVFWNRGAERLYGWTGAEAMGQVTHHLLRTVFPVSCDVLDQALLQEGQWEGELMHTQRDGTQIVVASRQVVKRDQQGQPTAILEINRDITERKRAEKALHESEERFAVLSDATFEGIVISDKGRILDANDQMAAMFGYERLQLVGLSVESFVAPESREIVTQHIRSGSDALYEHVALRKDGSTFAVETRANALPYKDRIVRVTAVRDITERKRAKDEILKLNEELEQRVIQRTAELQIANKELEAFSYSVSHDLRAPLRSIDGFSRILQEDFSPQLSEDAQRYLKLVRANTVQMGHLVDDLLSFSRLSRQPLNKQTVAPAKLVRQVLDDLRAEQDGRQIKIEIGDLPDCEADPGLLKQVWVNLGLVKE